MALLEQISNLLGLKQSKAKGLLGVHFHKDGVSLAYTSQPAQKGQIDLCEFIACEESERFKQVKKFVAKHSLGKNLDVNLILPPPDYRTLTIDAPDIEPSEYHHAAAWLVKDLLDYPVTEADIDLFPMPAGEQKKLYLICARQSVIRGYISEFQKLHMNLMGTETIELALRNLLLLKQVDNCLLMFKTDYFTGVMIYKHQTIYLVRSIRADLDEMSHRKLITELKRSLDYFKNQTKEEPPQKIILTPNLLVYDHLQEHLTNQFNMSIEYIDPRELVTMPELDDDANARCVIAIGATQSLQAMQMLQAE